MSRPRRSRDFHFRHSNTMGHYADDGYVHRSGRLSFDDAINIIAGTVPGALSADKYAANDLSGGDDDYMDALEAYWRTKHDDVAEAKPKQGVDIALEIIAASTQVASKAHAAKKPDEPKKTGCFAALFKPFEPKKSKKKVSPVPAAEYVVRPATS